MRKIFDNLFLCIGAMKAGTSWLYMVLKDHPAVECPPVKELHYFWELFGDFRTLTYEQRLDTVRYNLPRILGHTSQDQAESLMLWFSKYLSEPVDDVWFASLYANRSSKTYAAEFSNLYTGLPLDAWRHVRQLSRNIRLLYMMRSPIGRLWSHTRFQSRFSGQLGELSGWGHTEFSNFISEHRLETHARYSSTIKLLAENFSPDEYMLCQYEDITRSPLELMRTVEDFLGIAHHAYDQDVLARVHNGSERLIAPAAFYQVAVPFVETEIEALQRLSIPIPDHWLEDLRQSREIISGPDACLARAELRPAPAA